MKAQLHGARGHDGDLAEINLTGAWDPNTGLQYQVRKVRWPELYRIGYDPDALNPSPPVPVGCESLMEDVFGDYAKSGRLKLAMHPWFRRWGIFEYVKHPEHGKQGWFLIQLFQQEPQPGYLPEDMRTTDGRFTNLRGRIGEYCPPNREWMTWVKAKCDMHLNTTEDIMATVTEERRQIEIDTEREHEARVHDMHSYYWDAFRDLHNREAGCGWKMALYGTAEDPRIPHEEAKPEVWDVEQKNGYTIRRKRLDLETEVERAWKEIEGESRQDREARLEYARLQKLARQARIEYARPFSGDVDWSDDGKAEAPATKPMTIESLVPELVPELVPK